MDTDRLGEQIRYAVRRAIPLVLIIGPDELEAGVATIRDLERETQKEVPAADLVEELGAAISQRVEHVA